MRSKAIIATILATVLPAAALGVPTAVVNFTRALPGTTAAAQPSLAGPVLTDRVLPYSTLPGAARPAKGTVQVRTVRGADGRLNFYWRIVAHPSSRDVVHALEIYRFPRRVYDANYRIDGLGTVKPVMVTGHNTAAGWRMEFVFRPTIRPGQQSRFFFLRGRTPGTQAAMIRIRFESGRSAFIRAVAPR